MKLVSPWESSIDRPESDIDRLQHTFCERNWSWQHLVSTRRGYTNETIELLQENFDVSIISRNFYIQWPPKICDLRPSDFILWGYLRSLFFRYNLGFSSSYTGLWSKVRYCRDDREDHLNNVLFRTFEGFKFLQQ